MIAIGIGRLSIACSLAFWAWAGLFLFTPLNRSDAWLHFGLGAGKQYFWLALWAFGFLLALVATALGSRRWVFAAILALVSFAGSVLLLSTVHW